MVEQEKINAEVISVFPNKVKISVDKLEDFCLAEEKLKVGSYLRIADNDNAVLIAIIENFSIEVGADKEGNATRKYILEANPLGLIRGDKFERGGDTIAIPPKKVEPAKKEEISKIYEESLEAKDKFTFSKLSTNKDISVPVNGNKFFNKHIAIVGSTGSGKSHTVAKLIQSATHEKTGEYSGLNNSHIIIFDIHSEYKSAFPDANFIDINNLILPYWLLNGDELEELFLESGDFNNYNQASLLQKVITENKKKYNSELENISFDTPVKFILNEVITCLSNLSRETKDYKKTNEIAIKEIFKSKFNVSFDDVEFNDNEKYVEITLPRNVEKYSTGEVNLMVFTFTIYQFIASNKEILIVDDPLSSYDISNQYRIMFDLVQASSSGKKVIILTHNIDCINIANTQHRNIFKYKYIEKVDGILYLKDINLNESDSVLSISNLLAYVSTDENKDKYFKLLIEREDDLQAPENLVFHYDRSYSFEYENVNLTNEYFVSLIDNLDNNFVYNKSFEQNAIDKIFYMTAIRIWIEEKFYQNNPNDNSLNGKTFGEKIEYMFPKNGQTRWKGSSSVTRKYLMSKKTMINQHNHYKSQILPFNYALNITLDELKNEILDIKNHFNN